MVEKPETFLLNRALSSESDNVYVTLGRTVNASILGRCDQFLLRPRLIRAKGLDLILYVKGFWKDEMSGPFLGLSFYENELSKADVITVINRHMISLPFNERIDTVSRDSEDFTQTLNIIVTEIEKAETIVSSISERALEGNFPGYGLKL